MHSKIFKVDVPCQEIPANRIGYGIALFEKVNTTGQRLTVYDLIVSRYGGSTDQKNLNEKIRSQLKGNNFRNGTLEHYPNDYTIEYDNEIYAIWHDGNNLPSPSFCDLFINCLALQIYWSNNPNTFPQLIYSKKMRF